MRLICPSCGAVASAEAWMNDAVIRNFLETALKLAGPVQTRALHYLGLFRQGQKALPWRRALTIVKGLRDLTEQETVHWQSGETRPATPDLWGRAMEATLATGPKGLKNHNYLRHVAWEMAAELAATAEKDREAALRKRTKPVDEEPAPLSDATRKQIEEFKGKQGYGEKAHSMKMIEPVQIQLIHIAKAQLGLSEEEYRQIIETRARGKESSKDLTYPKASALIDYFKTLGFKIKSRRRHARPRTKGNVVGLPSRKERDLISLLVKKVPWRLENGYQRWLNKHMRIQRIATSEQAEKVIEGLKGLLKHTKPEQPGEAECR